MKNKNQIKLLQDKVISTLVPLIQSNYALLDIPDHGNIGDHLIYEGELIFLNKYLSEYKCVHSSSCHSFDKKQISDDTVILLHGGGNLGDIYDLHQNFRLDIIQTFPANRIIILPQTVFYNDCQKLKQDCVVFNSHKNLFICVRDQKSYDLLKDYIDINRIFLLPDMAFFIDLSMYTQPIQEERKALLMHRIDVEGTIAPDIQIIESLKNRGLIVDIEDWPTFYRTFNTRFYNLRNRFRNIFINILLKSSLFPSLIKNDTNCKILKQYYMKVGIQFMNKYDVVYTTRLHGLILAILLGKRSVLLDNSYGKLSSFYEAWLTDFSDVRKLKED